MFLITNFFVALANLVNLVIVAYIWIIIARAIISWVSPDPYNPIVRFLYRVTEPVLRPVRERLPTSQVGLDFSPMIVILVLYFLKEFLVPVLYRIATEVGATKIALGHHADDFIETLLLNLFFAGSLKAMPAKLVSDDGAHVVIRPLVYVGEVEARAYTKECGLPIIGCCCPACGDLGLQRQRAKRLLMELEREHPGVKQSMLKALSNVVPKHLLDARLNPPGELRARVATAVS